tara:strand:+ start:58 stop:312 length:255 start_codon:yes stop_codon:yes gene_type:complete
MPLKKIEEKSDMRGSKHKNTRRMNRLEELGRVDSEKAYSKRGRRNLKDEKKRIIRELQGPRTKRAGGGMAQRGLGRAFMKGGKA